VRRFDVVVPGASGLTGRLALRHLATSGHLGDHHGVRWAAAGRSAGRVREALAAEGAQAPVVEVDVEDEASLDALAESTTVVVSFVGPCTATAERVVAACVRHRTSYVGISGELPLLRRVIDRFDAPAREAGVAVVQVAGWEALPADVTTLLAAHAAVTASGPAGGPGQDGPGAGGEVELVEVRMSYDRTPAGSTLRDAVSAGTLGSVVEILADPAAGTVGDPGGLLDAGAARRAVRRASPFRVRPRTSSGRVVGPVAPVTRRSPGRDHRQERTSRAVTRQSVNTSSTS
jgi:Saccharopine dehydrogenase NADP binding domain